MKNSTKIIVGGFPDPSMIHESPICIFTPSLLCGSIIEVISSLIAHNDYDFLCQYIQMVLTQNQCPKTLSTVVSAITNKLPEFLQLLIKNTKKDVLENSYQHENGFQKWVLLSNPEFKVRLHIYEDSTLIPLESRHNHSWNYSSIILTGCLQNTIYHEIAEGEEELLHYQYSPVQDEEYTTLLLGSSRLSKSDDIHMTKKSGYYMPADVVHRISYEQTFKQRTATLMITGKRINYNCDLFTDKPFKAEKNIVSRFSEAAMRSIFDEVATY